MWFYSKGADAQKENEIHTNESDRNYNNKGYKSDQDKKENKDYAVDKQMKENMMQKNERKQSNDMPKFDCNMKEQKCNEDRQNKCSMCEESKINEAVTYPSKKSMENQNMQKPAQQQYPKMYTGYQHMERMESKNECPGIEHVHNLFGTKGGMTHKVAEKPYENQMKPMYMMNNMPSMEKSIYSKGRVEHESKNLMGRESDYKLDNQFGRSIDCSSERKIEAEPTRDWFVEYIRPFESSPECGICNKTEKFDNCERFNIQKNQEINPMKEPRYEYSSPMYRAVPVAAPVYAAPSANSAPQKDTIYSQMDGKGWWIDESNMAR